MVRYLYYRTVGEIREAMKLSDGKIVRVYPLNEDGELTVDVKNPEEIFDGVIFDG